MIKNIFIILMFILSANTYALTEDELNNKALQQHVKTTLSTLSLVLFNKNTECSNLSLDGQLSEQVLTKIKSFKLTDEQLKTALFYFKYKAYNQCVGDLPLQVIAYVNLAHEMKLNLGTMLPLNADNYTVNNIQEIIYKSDYLKLPESVRVELSKFEELKKPFNITSAYTRIIKK